MSFGPRTTPEAVGLELQERRRLENAAVEMRRLQAEVDVLRAERNDLREMNQVLSVAFRSSGHSALNRELEQLREALNEERMRSVEARAEVLRYDEAERERQRGEEQKMLEMQRNVSEASNAELSDARKTISGLRARIDDLEEQLLKERQTVTRASAIVATRAESAVALASRTRIDELETKLAERDAKMRDLVRLVATLQAALSSADKSNATLNFLRSV
jgi:hypothetical protein